MTMTEEAPGAVVPAGTPKLNAALAAAQAEMPPIGKDGQADITGEKNGRPFRIKYNYADLAAITAVAYPIMGGHGLSFSSQPTLNDNGKFVLQYQLRHESGESLDGVMPLPSAGKPQDLGSILTYYRRYAFCAVTGIHPGGEDDDASSANTEQRFDTPRSAAEAWENATPAPQRGQRQQPRQDLPPVTVPPLDPEDPWADKVTSITTKDEGTAAYAEVADLLKAGTIDQVRATRLGAVITARVVGLPRAETPQQEQAPAEQAAPPARIRQEDQGTRKSQRTTGGDDEQWITDFRARLADCPPDGLTALQREVGKAVANRTISSDTSSLLSREVQACRNALAGASA